MTFEALKAAVAGGVVDTVVACMVDMQGRLMGKRFTGQHFVDHAHRETHCCNYLLATDLEMFTVDGYAATSWREGYGDYHLKPDLTTLRPMAWLQDTVMVLCDVLDHHGAPVAHSPREILKAQIARARALGFDPAAATELEFSLFADGYDAIRSAGFRNLTPFNAHNQDYSILLTSREEPVLQPLRNALVAAGIPVENTKGEAEAGQQELNIRYAGALDCADFHTIAKHATKEVAFQHGVAATFLPKWHPDRVGNSAHVHQSLWRDGKSAFADPAAAEGMSATMRAYVAGLIAHAAETTYFLAPYVNSYKRFVAGTFAPTRIAWSVDNRTAGFRLCGAGTAGVRIECRIGGSDLNPYLAIAAQLAAGLAGIEAGLELGPPVTGDIYANRRAGAIPANLPAAVAALKRSKMLRAAFGDAVIDHYVHAGMWEQQAFERAVTDYELARGFERA